MRNYGKIDVSPFCSFCLIEKTLFDSLLERGAMSSSNRLGQSSHPGAAATGRTLPKAFPPLCIINNVTGYNQMIEDCSNRCPF